MPRSLPIFVDRGKMKKKALNNNKQKITDNVQHLRNTHRTEQHKHFLSKTSQ